MTDRLLRLALLLLLGGSIARAAQYPVTVLSPHDMQRVPYRPCLVGVGPHDGQDLWVILHPTLWSNYYVQPAVSWVQENRFRVTLYVGERGQNSSAGQIFELQIFKGNAYREGMKLGAFPSAGAVSPVIRLVRDDRASDNCDVAVARSAAPTAAGSTTSDSLLAPNSPAANTAAVEALSAQPNMKPAAVSPFATGLRRYAQMAAFRFCAFALLMLIVLVRLNDRAAEAALWASKWIEVFLGWLGCLAEKFADSVAHLGAWLSPRAMRAGASAETHDFYRGNRGLFERCIEGLYRARDHGIRTRVNTVVGPWAF